MGGEKASICLFPVEPTTFVRELSHSDWPQRYYVFGAGGRGDCELNLELISEVIYNLLFLDIN